VFARVAGNAKKTASSSWLGPHLRLWWARRQERRFRRALIARRRSAAVGDALYQVLLGRPANRGELAYMRHQAKLGRPLSELTQELKETVEGSRTTVNSFNPAVRVWLRSQFEPETADFPAPRLAFLHLARTGGTSLSDLFARWYGPDQSRVHLFVDEVALTPVPVLANLRIIAGHLPFAGLSLIPGPFLTMTVLRDPFERTLSHFYNLKRYAPLYQDATLEQFVFNEEEFHSGNYQALYLAHDVDLANAWRTYSPEERLASMGFDRYEQNPLQMLFEITIGHKDDEQLLGDAAANLERIDLVGTTDNLDVVASRVARLFGVPPQPPGRLNRSTPVVRSEIDARIRRRIDERTAVDRQLYDRARQRSSASTHPSR
jgi:hypothetical protein